MLCLAALAVATTQCRAGNVLLIIADDLGWDSLSLYNDHADATFPPTPAIDSLAARGVMFERAYAYPTCSPTRSSILTGRHGFRTGVLRPEPPDDTLTSNELTLPEVLLAAGVIGDRMAHIGKWHLGADAGSPNSVGGWPHFAGALSGGLASYTNWTKVVDGSTLSNYTRYATSDNVDDALTWIAAQGEQEWFLWLAFNAPHTPLHRPPAGLHSYADLSGEAADISANPRPYYEAMVEAMDTEIARLLAAVDLQETTVIFIGDNGTPNNVIQRPIPNGHAKGTIYEGGVRVPMLIAGQAVAAQGRSSLEPVHAADLYATILELFGVDTRDYLPPGYPVDSRSLVPVLVDEPFEPETPIVFSAMKSADGNVESAKMACDGTFKLVRFSGGSEALFNIATSVRELTNLLDGSLTPLQQAAYTSLSAHLDGMVNVPEVLALTYDAGNQVQLDVAWFAGADLSVLWSGSLATDNWAEVPSVLVEDNGGPTFRLSFSKPQDGVFFRVASASAAAPF